MHILWAGETIGRVFGKEGVGSVGERVERDDSMIYRLVSIENICHGIHCFVVIFYRIYEEPGSILNSTNSLYSRIDLGGY